jgi:hypothetical protein
MEVLEIRTADTHRNVEWPGGLEDFLDGARSVGHEVAKLHGVERWLIFNPATMAWCEVGHPVIATTS